jgi:hypothetical protein
MPEMSNDKLCLRLQRWLSERSIEERLATLTEFIRYWYGEPPRERLGAPLALPGFLPAPLKWLYQTIADYDEGPFRSALSGWMRRGVFIEFHSLKHPSHMDVDESGFIPFVNENQGVYQCATTNSRGDDPPVFLKDFGEEPWEPLMARLSDFLLMLLVSELTYGAPNGAWGMFPAEVFQKFVAPLVHVDIERAIWLGGAPWTIHHGTDLAASSALNSDGSQCVQVAARTADVLNTLESMVKWDSWCVDGELVVISDKHAKG